jgi:RNA polymerase sigma-70 factor (ECF subfamily)
MTLGPSDIEAAYRSHGHSVLRRARRLLGDDQEAREVLQEIFTSLLAKPDQFGGRSSILTWLYTVTTHACLNRIRNRRTRLRILEAQPRSEASPAPDLEAMAAARQMLARLPGDQAEAAVYYYFDEMTHAEIADVLGCSRRHVGDLLERFRRSVAGERSTDAAV